MAEEQMAASSDGTSDTPPTSTSAAGSQPPSLATAGPSENGAVTGS
jgi:hypothetical protein